MRPDTKINVPTVKLYAAGNQESSPGSVVPKLAPMMCAGTIPMPRAAWVMNCAMHTIVTKIISCHSNFGGPTFDCDVSARVRGSGSLSPASCSWLRLYSPHGSMSSGRLVTDETEEAIFCAGWVTGRLIIHASGNCFAIRKKLKSRPVIGLRSI